MQTSCRGKRRPTIKHSLGLGESKSPMYTIRCRRCSPPMLIIVILMLPEEVCQHAISTTCTAPPHIRNVCLKPIFFLVEFNIFLSLLLAHLVSKCEGREKNGFVRDIFLLNPVRQFFLCVCWCFCRFPNHFLKIGKDSEISKLLC